MNLEEEFDDYGDEELKEEESKERSSAFNFPPLPEPLKEPVDSNEIEEA